MTKTTAASTTPCCSKIGIKKGPWSAEEDEILANFVHKEGEGRWRTLPKRAGLQRCGKSCRLRWMNYLRPSVKRGQIAPDEEDLILRLHRLLGNRWALIAGRLPGRTDNEIKNYWNTHLSKKLIKRGIDPRTHKPLVNSTNNINSTTITTVTSNAVVVLSDSQKVGYNHHHHHHDRCSNVVTTSSIVMPPPPPQQPTTVVTPASEIGNVINNSKFDYVPTISAGGGNIEGHNNNNAVNDGSIVFYHENNDMENDDTAEEDTLMVFLNSLFDGNNNNTNNEVMMNNNNGSTTEKEEELAAFQHYYHHHGHGQHDHDATMFPPPVSTSFRLEDWEAEFSNALMNQQDASSSPPPSIK
ncbi:hypothetical protein PIB30_085105 [Stylosanthes scabra]|uniref:Uncharacterized protein n=1 Tax=Stylosanthes scabra TaxID=79078 RepID=A0ABU6WSJ8_9FABA|nr:hypothetical protein [Stylosanthes scabra]